MSVLVLNKKLSEEKEVTIKKKSYDNITFKIIPHSHSRVYSISISFRFIRLMSFTIIILFFLGIFLFFFDTKNQVEKSIEDKKAYLWESKLWLVNDSLQAIEKQLQVIQENGDSLYQMIWNTQPKLDDKKQYSQNFNNRLLSLNRSLKFLLEREKKFRNLPIGRPLKTGYISSPFGSRISPFGFTQDFHTGFDFANATGTPIYVTADGYVTTASMSDSGYGNYIVVSHKYGFATFYGHCSELKVEKGDYVRRGQVIGLVGQSGSATGPHVHYEVRLKDKASAIGYRFILNPAPFMKAEL